MKAFSAKMHWSLPSVFCLLFFKSTTVLFITSGIKTNLEDGLWVSCTSHFPRWPMSIFKISHTRAHWRALKAAQHLLYSKQSNTRMKYSMIHKRVIIHSGYSICVICDTHSVRVTSCFCWGHSNCRSQWFTVHNPPAVDFIHCQSFHHCRLH